MFNGRQVDTFQDPLVERIVGEEGETKKKKEEEKKKT